jgi:hypothetical protein
MPVMAHGGPPVQARSHASNRRGTTVTASGAMTAVPAGQGAMVDLAAMAPLSTETASRPLAARGVNRNGTTHGVRVGMQGAPRGGLAARQTVTAATGQAGWATPPTTCGARQTTCGAG